MIRSTCAWQPVAQTHLNRLEQTMRRQSERCWASRAVRIATSTEGTSRTLQCKGADPGESAQVVYSTGHVVTKRPAHGIVALRIVQLENSNTSLGVNAKTNQCTEVGASLLTTTLQLHFQ